MYRLLENHLHAAKGAFLPVLVMLTAVMLIPSLDCFFLYIFLRRLTNSLKAMERAWCSGSMPLSGRFCELAVERELFGGPQRQNSEVVVGSSPTVRWPSF